VKSEFSLTALRLLRLLFWVGLVAGITLIVTAAVCALTGK